MNIKSLSANSTSVLHKNEYLYNGKMFQDELGLNWLDYGARFYDPVVGRWWSEDPLANERPAWSPFRAFYCNPIKYVDPRGMLEDNYSVDDQGNVKFEEKTDDKFDVIYTKESWDNGKKDNSVTVDKDVIRSKKINSVTAEDQNKYTIDLYTVKGDDNAKELFEFMSTNTKVEWSQTLIGAEKNHKSIISTSHNKDKEVGQGYVFGTGYTIRGHNHSHPYNNKPSSNDKNWATILNKKFPKAKLQIFYKGNYSEYDNQGLISNKHE